jgi:hypothetical protein
MKRRRLILGAGAVAAAGAGAALYARFIEPHWVEVVRRPLPISGLPRALEGRRLVHLSDLHLGHRVGAEYLVACLRRTRDLEPDILALTGDFITYRGPREVEDLARLLADLPRGRLATVAVLGNHDYGSGWAMPEVAAEVTRALSDAGVTVLCNAATDVGGLTVAGLGDLWAGEFHPERVLAGVGPGPAIVLCHNPDAADRPGWGGYRGWILAGHTHGGQCRMPLLGPPILPVRNKRYAAGEVDLGDGRRLYVNRGLGHLLPVRFLVRPEMTLFTLMTADRVTE